MLEEPGCVEVFLHPLLKVLEVTQENVSAVLETSHNITGTEILNFDILRALLSITGPYWALLGITGP